MLRKYANMLLAPEGATVAAEPPASAGGVLIDGPADSINLFMGGLPSLDEPTAPPGGAAPKPEGDKPNVEPAAKPAGAEPPAKPAGTPAAGDKPAAAAAVDKSGDKPGAAAADSKSGATEEDRYPRNSSDWETFKKNRATEREKAKADLAAREATITELQTKVKTLEEGVAEAGKASPEETAQIERLTKTMEGLNDQIRLLDVTAHPKFKAHFEGRYKEQTDIAAQILGADKGKEFENIVKIPDTPELAAYKKEKMETFIGDLSQYHQGVISSVVTNIMGIDRDRNREIEKNKEHVAQLTAQRTDQVKQVQAAREKLFTGAITAADDPVIKEVFSEKAGNDDWNKAVAQRVATARLYFFGGKDVKPEHIAKAAIHAAAFPAILEAYKTDMAEKDGQIATLTEQVKKLTAANPGGGKGSSVTPPGGESPSAPRGPAQGATPEEVTKSYVGNIMAAFNE